MVDFRPRAASLPVDGGLMVTVHRFHAVTSSSPPCCRGWRFPAEHPVRRPGVLMKRRKGRLRARYGADLLFVDGDPLSGATSLAPPCRSHGVRAMGGRAVSRRTGSPRAA
jgi:hypothetical protein